MVTVWGVQFATKPLRVRAVFDTLQAQALESRDSFLAAEARVQMRHKVLNNRNSVGTAYLGGAVRTVSSLEPKVGTSKPIFLWL